MINRYARVTRTQFNYHRIRNDLDSRIKRDAERVGILEGRRRDIGFKSMIGYIISGNYSRVNRLNEHIIREMGYAEERIRYNQDMLRELHSHYRITGRNLEEELKQFAIV